MDQHVLDDLEARGLLAHTTDIDALRTELSTPTSYYVGFDPTAPSLHMGNLVQLVTARRLQLAGHKPVILVGGATGMIGDPKEAGERVLNSTDVVAGWVERIRQQVARFVSFDGSNAATVVNNLDWTQQMTPIDFLRDIGKHFPVNRMLGREVVRSRLEAGISYTEFSYVLLQSMDYLELFRRHDCRLQTGGSDQWGNITAGVELIRRVEGANVHALATPLVTKADGTKYGKTEAGTVWLDPQMMSPYEFHQFWLQAEDAKVGEYLKIFSFRTVAAIDKLMAEHEERPQARLAQRALAADVTTLVHGADELAAAEQAAQALFGRADLSTLSEPTLAAALAGAPHASLSAAESMPSVVDAFVATGLASSRGAARRTVDEGGAYVNNQRVTAPDEPLPSDALLHGRWLVLRKGKRSVAGVEVVPA
ncbi:MAG: Tyrosyl-tRNA synthetase [uncultured Nocardioidaceae bacterium]|uniref:Tyrosine--tRNA ligase n=1 Tax=uncultured Nocardioidaceae bacterium TaxID=253824 RepID=A0A6J4L684_9ACTN|nr:MAG: Tyrosyl-tRNA synthetase [uncultured Nocardioidaceae bacterium]